MTTPLEQIKERIEKLEINPAYKAYAGYYNMALSDIQAILPSIIQEVEAGKRNVYEYRDNEVLMSLESHVDTVSIIRDGQTYKISLTSLKEEPNNV